MPNSKRYVDFNSGDNEWLSQPLAPDADEEETKAYNEKWAELKKDCSYPIEFSEDIYSSCEFEGPPEWIDVHIRDEYILEFKMAKGIISSMQGADSIVFRNGFDCDVEKNWGGIGMQRLSIHQGHTYVTMNSKHGNDELEINITEQFNQAIGE